MPTYIADVRDSKGAAKKDKIVADSLGSARDALREKWVSVANIKETQTFDLSKLNLKEFQTSLAKVTVKDKAVFSRQFAAMVNAGVAIVRCLGVLSEQCSNPKLKKALVEISSEVQQGVNLSDAMRKHPECFDNLYVSMVQAGEVGGVLDEVLNRLAKVLEDMARLQNQVKGAMAYPVAVGILAIIVFICMTVFLIPIFAGIFKDLGTELPALTLFMLWISEILRSWRIIIPIITVIVASFVYRQYYKTPVGRVTMDRFFLKMPLLGDLNEKSCVARFCRIFGTLTRSGVPILTCMDIVRDTAGNQVIANAVEAAKLDIQQGGMMSLALQKEQVFPILAIQMISIGEETGQLDAMMMKVADFYEDEVEQAVKALTSVLEPIMMVVLAGMVAVILLSMYLPMFAVFDKLG
ncbi:MULTISPECIES: type II secretion system F family protein [unclassified Coleofasciculus]|uniref:type II secretion system F family protein n=1 Tax=Cyanophyceae TaxID=3028117 RepID=UPI001686FFB1|nr:MULTISPECIES: type II secretion system F family protein [unclassified Coleofasciculus]MBD1879722.1 type II secretion system F family protein [Coleofasciculus sp. FACHB-T130]MBD2084478.1 type II secretion system F family protein [Coleofasciculus sp. FACHB-542]MBD2540547.1 type II secretion system F family protein [Coleofasciculus sp. FACHB-SPT36]